MENEVRGMSFGTILSTNPNTWLSVMTKSEYLPIPASIYGIILLFLCLKLRIISHESVHETGKFLIEIMPLMFIPAAVGLLETWDVIAPAWLEYVAVTVLSTWIVMIISGKITQSVIRHRKKGVQENHV